MVNETSKNMNLTAVILGLMLLVGFGGLAYLWKNPQTTTRASLSDIQSLEAQIQDLKKSLAELKTAAPTAPAPQADPAMAAQLKILNASLAAMAESQKALVAKLAQPAPTPTPTPAPAAIAPVAPITPVAPVAAPIAKRPPVPAALNELEAAYKQAWDTDQPVIVGQVKDPQTGKLSGGRTLDPSSAKSLGVASWQEWYASAEKTRSETLTQEADLQRVANQERLVEIPRTTPPKP